MPRKYPDETKREAVGMLELHDDISFIHYTTGVHKRTLRRWRDELRTKQNSFLSEKTCPSDTKQTQTPLLNENETIIDQADTAKTDLDDFTYIREQLMKYARQMAADLRPGEPDSNRRTLALSRILDRIQWLDQILPDRFPQQTVRWEFYYDDQVQEHPPWHDAAEQQPRASLEDLLPNPSASESLTDDDAV